MSKPVRIMTAGLLAVMLCGPVSSNGVGDAAPDFTRADLGGRPVRLAGYRGKVVLLNFWASWCGPCLKELPRFSTWQQAYGAEGLQIIGVSMDDESAPVKRLLARRPVPYPVVMGDAKLGESFGGVLGLPLTYLIDRQGCIVARYQGESDLGRMEEKIKALLPHS